MKSNNLVSHQSSQAGASFGTGYCDAQCPADLKFINGEANCMDWTGNTNVHMQGVPKKRTFREKK